MDKDKERNTHSKLFILSGFLILISFIVQGASPYSSGYLMGLGSLFLFFAIFSMGRKSVKEKKE